MVHDLQRRLGVQVLGLGSPIDLLSDRGIDLSAFEVGMEVVEGKVRHSGTIRCAAAPKPHLPARAGHARASRRAAGPGGRRRC